MRPVWTGRRSRPSGLYSDRPAHLLPAAWSTASKRNEAMPGLWRASTVGGQKCGLESAQRLDTRQSLTRQKLQRRPAAR